jgi:hypothetical protein
VIGAIDGLIQLERSLVMGVCPGQVTLLPRYEAKVTKENGSSWIFELCLTWANALQPVQRSAFSLVRYVLVACALVASTG